VKHAHEEASAEAEDSPAGKTPLEKKSARPRRLAETDELIAEAEELANEEALATHGLMKSTRRGRRRTGHSEGFLKAR